MIDKMAIDGLGKFNSCVIHVGMVSVQPVTYCMIHVDKDGLSQKLSLLFRMQKEYAC